MVSGGLVPPSLRRNRPVEPVTRPHLKEIAHHRLAGATHRPCLKPDPPCAAAERRRQGEHGLLIGGGEAQAAPLIAPANVEIHIQRGAVVYGHLRRRLGGRLLGAGAGTGGQHQEKPWGNATTTMHSSPLIRLYPKHSRRSLSGASQQCRGLG
jgi:hypothetical protein